MANRFSNWLKEKPTIEAALVCLTDHLTSVRGNAAIAVTVFEHPASDATVFVAGGRMAAVLRRALNDAVEDMDSNPEFTRVSPRRHRRNPKSRIPDAELAELRKIVGFNSEGSANG